MLHLTIWLAIGLGAGWFARWVLAGGREYGLIGDLTTGCLGAVVGGWLMRKFQVIAPDNLLGHVFTALVGAVALLIIIRRLRQTLPAVAMITAAQGRLAWTGARSSAAPIDRIRARLAGAIFCARLSGRGS